MARSAATAVENNFRAGLISEASGLNFPESASQDALNVVFDLRGRVYRRLGIDWETSALFKSIDRTGCAITIHEWRNATGDGTRSFLVKQVGNNLYIYDSSSTSTPSGHYKTLISLTTFKPSGAPDPKAKECQFTNGVARLFIVHPTLEAFYIKYDATADTFTATQIDITTRDLEGLDDSATNTITNRPAVALSAVNHPHYYNVFNQGWTQEYLVDWNTLGTVPSNADVWWTFKNGADQFDVTTLANVDRGNTPAPKGHFIMNLFNQDRHAAVIAEYTPSSDLSDLATTSTGYNRFSTAAFFAGRLFYAGLNYEGQNSKIHFTQIIERDAQYGQCYQKNDPTAETLFALEPDDGGYINIPEAGTIYKVFAMQSALVVFALHGVFTISGSSGIGFTATDYSVTKISSFRVTSNTTFVEVNGAPVWWTGEGIFTVTGNSTGIAGGLTVKSITLGSIQTFFDALPLSSKVNARGTFNPSDYCVYWVYRNTAAATTDQNYEFDSVLVWNTITNAFYPWRFDTTNCKIHGVFAMDTPTNSVDSTVLKFLASKPDTGTNTNFTFAELRRTNYLDWFSFDNTGVDFSSYFLTGYKVHGEAIRRFQPNWTAWYHQGVGQCYVQGVWDYGISGGRETAEQKLIFADANVSNDHRRVKIRGNGYALQFKVSSVTGQPFTLIGWVSYETGNSAP